MAGDQKVTELTAITVADRADLIHVVDNVSSSPTNKKIIVSDLLDIVNVKHHGATGDGSTDDTAAIKSAVAVFSSGNGEIYFPAGTYKVTSTITIDQDRIHIRGDGKWATEIQFTPTANDICFFFGKGGEGTTDSGTIVQCSMKGFALTSTDTTFTKTAIEMKDQSLCSLKDIAVGTGSLWNGGSDDSIGLRLRGRESLFCARVDLLADKPLVLALNDSAKTLCADHFHFQDMFLRPSSTSVLTNACITCEPGVNTTNMTFDGYQSWVRGKYGFFYDNED